MSIRPRRSALYVPGSNERAIEKAKTLDVDTVIFDLEDAVGPEEKAVARQHVAHAVASGAYGRRELAVRVNGLETEWGKGDIASIAAAGPDAVLVPKVEAPGQLKAVAQAVSAAGGDCALWAMIETPRAIVDLGRIAACAETPDVPLSCFVAGTNDLLRTTHALLNRERTAALFWLSSIVTAARAFGLAVLDGVYNNFHDRDGFADECRQGRMLGMDGKTLIHPGQIAAANELFAPSPEEIVRARQILMAFARPENQGKGAINLDGEMVEQLHAEIARRTVALADAIGL